MIVTVTPNPSLDRTMLLDDLRRGAVHRASKIRLDPGGKGVNVARTLAAADHPAVAVLPAGGPEGARLAELLAPENVSVVEIPTASATRSNVTLVEADGTTTKINEPGRELSTAEIEGLRTRTAELAARAEWVVASGSLPAGCPDDFYARLVEATRASGARIAVDTSGPPLREACREGADLVTPNLDELSELAGRPLCRLGEVVDLARQVQAEGVATVLVSLGADGAVLVEGNEARHGTSTSTLVRSTVGAGDALLAGFLLAGAEGPEALRHAVAHGTAAVRLPGSRMPTPSEADPEAVRVTDVDESLTLNGTAA